MSKLINFNARDFRIDCEDKSACERMFFTQHEGTNGEMYVLGDWRWAWAQIKCDKVLEKNTDYVFTFELRGGYCDTRDENVQLSIAFDDNWEDRYTYPLVRDRLKAKYSKTFEGEYVRAFEIPFNTGEAEKTTIVISSQHAVSYFTPMQKSEFYEGLEDYCYTRIWENKVNKNDFSNNDFDFGGQVYGCNIGLSGTKISQNSLAKLMKKFGDGCNVDLSDMVITDDDNFDELSNTDDSEIPDFAKEQMINGFKSGLTALQTRYDNCPDGSVEKGALKLAMEQIKTEMAQFTDLDTH